ncbi:hypothetical protein [Psychrobacillus sp. OK032]|uniref:hypothetical protein n=1 Tax=Psychrobacillus sp. OK032 TaxID=1884358 RepID=UPI0008B98EF3|nr:hypothetical protein [Psychrobacillus sp. OK032]SER88246.1 hypothetical protein SAMN05518872_102483 [Psychrobacillus sp. OK032]
MVVAQALTTASIGRHSELLAQTALLANGWTVLESIVPAAFDIAVTKRGDNRICRCQVKTLIQRTKDGVDYYVLKGKKNSGEVYDKYDCDVFIGVTNNVVYLVENRCISEYWARVDEVAEKWTELPTTL